MIRVFIAVAIIAASCFVRAGETEKPTIGYSSYEAALTELKRNPNANVSVQGGWTIIEVNLNNEMALWSFTPEGHFAHPAVVKRNVVESEGSVHIVMNALCSASKSDCGKLIKQFEQLNEQISKNMRKGS